MTPGFDSNGFRLADKISFFILVLMVVTLLLSGCNRDQKPFPVAVNGIMDFAGWDFETNGGVSLEGRWAFYWQQLPTVTDGKPGAADLKKTTLNFPSQWTDHKKERPELTEFGFATYGLTLVNIPFQENLVLRVNSLMGAYKIWINGNAVFENGVVGKHTSSQIQGQLGVVFIPIPSIRGKNPDRIELLVQVSKYQYISGGTEFSFVLGPEKQLINQWNWERFILIFSCTILLSMGSYHLIFFFFRRKDPSLIYFSISCFAWMTTVLATGASHWLVIFLFGEVPLTTLVIIDHMGYFFAIPFLFLFTRSIFPDETSSFLPNMYFGLASILAVWFSFDAVNRSMITMIMHIVAVSSMVFCASSIFRAVLARRHASFLILFGVVFLMVCGFNGILNDLRIIHTIDMMSLGLLVFICSQASSLALRFATAFDLTEELGAELKEKNIALSRLDTLKDEFIANTTHELLTPLSGIIGIAESMMAGATGKLPHSAVQNLGMLAASGQRLNGLVKNILDFSRLKNKDLELNLRPVHIRNMVDLTLKLLTPLADAKKLQLVNGICQGLSPVMADENRLHQIFNNLIGNAIKYTPQGQVTVTAQEKKKYMEIAVKDTGIGIPEAKHEDIFLHFEQVHSARSKEFEGTGLGLPITKHLIELHKGTIRLESREEFGATFYFTLPFASRKDGFVDPVPQIRVTSPPVFKTQVTLPNSISPSSNLSGDCPRILVVDDDAINLQVAVNHLGTQGFSVETALSGEQALKMLPAGNKPDLILLDIMMPEMDGYEVCRKLRETHSMSSLPVIMLTARNQFQDLVKGFDSGANDYLTKPFSRDELLARVHTQLKLKRAYKVLKENSRLKKEIERRKITELDLKMLQHRLGRILDSLGDAILAVNESLEICFSNTPCQDILGYEGKELLGQPVAMLFSQTADGSTGNPGRRISDFLKSVPTSMEFRHKDGRLKTCLVAPASLDIENEVLQVLIIQQPAKGSRELCPEQRPGIAAIEEIKRSQYRIEMLENTLGANGLVSRPGDARKIHSLGEDHIPGDKKNAGEQERNQLGVTVMTLALDLWVDETGTTRVDLAEQSGIWKVYMNHDGFERTQTLDKYLNIKKFPRFPRWFKIYQTVDFVLLSCRLSSRKKDVLETDYSRLKKMV